MAAINFDGFDPIAVFPGDMPAPSRLERTGAPQDETAPSVFELTPPPKPALIRARSDDLMYTLTPEVPSRTNSVWHLSVLDYDILKEMPVMDESNEVPLNTVFLLDTTASMTGKKIKEAKEALKTYIREMQTAEPTHLVSLFTFDLYFTNVYKNLCVMDEEATVLDLFLGSNTALYDAIVHVILACDLPPSILIILTDGDDNSSLTRVGAVNALLERAKKAGWRFTFIGCDFQAVKQAELLVVDDAMHATADAPVKMCLQRASTETVRFNRSVSDSASRRNQSC
jgi:hypothetical protein